MKRLAAADTYVGYAPQLEDAILPQVGDIKRAVEELVKFYRELFGWQIQKVPIPDYEYWMCKTGDGPGIDGGLVPRMGATPAAGAPVNGFVITVDVPDVDAYTERALGEGATVALPKMAVPSVGWLVYLLDPDTNSFGMLQPDETAA